nr:monovalent cation/H+ antiporter complex subunit F [Actinomadura rayongensis]
MLVGVRLVRGPSMLDRAVALDVLVAVIMAGLGLRAIIADEPWELVPMLVVSLVGFTGSAAFARFMLYRDDQVADP